MIKNFLLNTFIFLVFLSFGVASSAWAVDISGTSSANSGETIACAINGSAAGTTTTNGTWTISGQTVNSGDAVVVWVDAQATGSESTGITIYDGSGNITGMVLSTNILTVGSNDNATVTVQDAALYDRTSDEDIMYSASSSTLTVDGNAEYGTSEVLSILAGNRLTIGGTQTLHTGDVTITGTLEGSGTAAISVESGTWNNNGTFITGSSSVTFDGGTVNTATTFYDLDFAGTSNIFVEQTVTVSNDFTISNTGSATIQKTAGQATINVAGDFQIDNSGSDAIKAGDLLLVMNGTSAQAIRTTTGSATELDDLQISNTSAAVTLTTGSLAIEDDITVDASAIFDIGTYNIIPDGAGTTLTVSGTFRLAGDQTLTNVTDNANAGGAVEYTATSGSRAIKNWTYNGTLSINGAGGTFTMGAGETLGDHLQVTAGTFDVSDQTLTINDNTIIDGGTMLTGTGVVTFGDAGGDSVTISSGELQIESDDTANDIVITAGTWTNSGGSITYAGNSVTTELLSAVSPYYNLELDDGGNASTYTLDGAITISNDFQITGGTLDTDNTNHYGITLGDDWTNADTFTARTATVTLTGTAVTITGSTTFYNLKMRDTNNNGTDVTLTVDNAATLTIGGTLILEGLDNGDRINLNSDDGSTRFDFSVSADQNVEWVDVSNSEVSGSADIIASNSIDTANTDSGDASPQWVFSAGGADAIFFGFHF